MSKIQCQQPRGAQHVLNTFHYQITKVKLKFLNKTPLQIKLQRLQDL